MLDGNGLRSPSPSRPAGATAAALAVVGLLAGGAASVAAAHQPDRSLDQFLDALQRRYAATRDFATEFVHTYEGGALRTRTSERGDLLVKKPGRMRWTYTSPERKLFVSDGQTMYAYVPADRQVVVSSVPQGDEAATPIQFLAGRGDLRRDFAASEVTLDDAPAGARTIKLVPKRPQPEYEWLVLAVDRETLRMRLLRSVDSQGGTSSFVFRNWRDNVGVEDTRFIFRIPRGTDVINQR
jgi:outer membrane lipoprotein carrier protein